jgi:rod shape determining protein RodA
MAEERRVPFDFDWLLLGATLALCVIGILFINSAKSSSGFLVAPEAKRQLVALAIGLAGLFVITRIDYHKLVAAAPWAYGVTLALNVAVLFLGREIGGNKAWLRLGGLSMQPAELLKVATIMLLAVVAARREMRVRLVDIAVQSAIVLLPVVIILRQSDTGTALTFLPLLASVVFVGGIRWRWIVAALIGVCALAPVAWSRLEPYQRDRVLVTLNPERERLGKGYHQIQSMIAVGSGGILGEGYEKGTQNRLGFLPERHTDFVFAIVSEEMGFLGAALVLGLYLVVLRRLADGAVLARDRLGGLLCLGAMMFIGVHVAVNVGMVLGLLPVIGITLPLLSYGGSSIIAFLAMIGLALNVRMRRLGR